MAKTTKDDTEASTEGPGKVMEQQVIRELRFKLSTEEQQKMANAAAVLSEQRNALKTELDLIGRTKRKELKDMQKEIDRLLACHKSGGETREVQCTEKLDWENKTVTHYHNGEEVSTREMHDSELQMKLTGTGNPTAKKAKKQTRAQKDPEKNLTPEEQQSEVAEVYKMETGRKTKKSSIDKHVN